MTTTPRAPRSPGGTAGILRAGDRGPRVQAVREQLVALGHLDAPQGEDEPAFDDDVTRAVRAFQQQRGLTADGLVGPETALSLQSARWRLGDRILWHVPGHLLQGDDVVGLQRQLQRLGVFTGRVDGLFGPQTERGLRELQRGVGLPPDGTCGPDTLRALSHLGRTVSGGDLAALHERDRVASTGSRLVGKVVVIDPGHGGDDPGARGNDLEEATVVLDLARRLEGRLTTSGVTAVLTRDRDQNPSDEERASLAQAVGADVFLSLHCDSGERTQSEQAEGVASFFWGGYDSTSFSGAGQRLAGLVQSEVVSRTGLVDCRTHPRTWDLLRLTHMPAVRVELGYLTSPRDARRLADPAFRDTCAEALLAAVQRLYFTEPEDWTTGTLSVDDVRALSQLRGE